MWRSTSYLENVEDASMSQILFKPDPLKKNTRCWTSEKCFLENNVWISINVNIENKNGIIQMK